MLHVDVSMLLLSLYDKRNFPRKNYKRCSITRETSSNWNNKLKLINSFNRQTGYMTKYKLTCITKNIMEFIRSRLHK